MYNNVITFDGKIIGYTDDTFTAEELEIMANSGVEIYTDICGNYINLLTGDKFVAVA